MSDTREKLAAELETASKWLTAWTTCCSNKADDIVPRTGGAVVISKPVARAIIAGRRVNKIVSQLGRATSNKNL